MPIILPPIGLTMEIEGLDGLAERLAAKLQAKAEAIAAELPEGANPSISKKCPQDHDMYYEQPGPGPQNVGLDNPERSERYWCPTCKASYPD